MFPLLGWCLFFKHYDKFTLRFQSMCNLSWEKNPISMYPSPGYLFVLQTLHHLYPSIPYTPYLVNVYSQDISPLPLHFNLYVPLLGKCLFARHYITSSTPFQFIRTTSLVTVYSQDMSPLSHSYLRVPPPW